MSDPRPPRPPARRRASALLLVLLVTAACGRTEAGRDRGVPAETYVQVMGHLAYLESHPPRVGGPAARRRASDSLRFHLLARFGAPPESLVAFARATGRDPARMQRIWERIDEVVDSLVDLEEPIGSLFRVDSATAARLGLLRPPTEAVPAAASDPGADSAAPARPEPIPLRSLPEKRTLRDSLLRRVERRGGPAIPSPDSGREADPSP